ncbi:conserved protein of unknown function precursor containing a T9SS type A C-terminal secretion signal [Tenacibaculum sp. 190524A02b]|uniref:zinc-dependent metalloprotease n=1 Tax=Tenacibaculum vairaonense TaxID=3137860 RepID=UPI0032B2DE82
MKNNLFFIILLLFGYKMFSQRCGTDQYLNALNSLDSSVKGSIRGEVNKIINKRKNLLQIDKSEETINIPVVFNLVYPAYYSLGQGANLHGSVIQNQIDILNTRYSGEGKGVDTKVRFCLAKQNIYGLKSTGIKRFFGESSYQPMVLSGNVKKHFLEVDSSIKKHMDNGFPEDSFLNIWVVDLKDYKGNDDLAGYSSTPIPKYSQNLPVKDGVVIDFAEVNKYTMSHEVGHWLGLFHVFSSQEISSGNSCDETDCELQGDFICDTDNVPRSGIKNIAPGECKGYNCNGKSSSVVQNYMDYQEREREYCYNNFTIGQKNRMRDVLKDKRFIIYNNSVLNLKNYCETPTNSGGGGYNPPFNLFCRTCYDPSFLLPDPYNKHYYGVHNIKNDFKDNTYIVSYFNAGFSRTVIYERNCLDFQEKQALDNVYGEVHIVDSDTFFVFSMGSSNNFKIYNKSKGQWSLVKEYSIKRNMRDKIIKNEKGIYFTSLDFHSGSNTPQIVTVYKFDKLTNTIINVDSFYTGFIAADSFGYHEINYSMSHESFFLEVNRGVFKQFDLSTSGNKLYYNSEFSVPLVGTYINDYIGAPMPGKTLTVGAYKDYLVVEELRNDEVGRPVPKKSSYLKVFKKEGLGWSLIKDIEINFGVREISFINEDFFIVRKTGYKEERLYLFKKDNNDGFELMNLNHMYANSPDTIDFLCSGNFSINHNTNELILDDRMLKLDDVLQTDTSNFSFAFEEKTTMDICKSIEYDSYQDFNIKISGNLNCKAVFNNTNKLFKASNQILISPNTIVSGGKNTFKISSIGDYNVCNFENNCTLSSKLNQDFVKKTDELNKFSKSQTSEGFEIYPNPVKKEVFISNYKRVSNFKLIDVWGNIVSSLNKLDSGKVSLSNLKKGIYVVRITSVDNKIFNKKIIKQ